jgi:hypothetical protein
MSLPSSNPTSVKTGSPYLQIQPARTGRNESGNLTDVVYETTDEDQAYRLALTYEVNGIMYDWEQTFGKSRITAHYPWNFKNNPASEPPVDSWEVINQKVQKSVLDSSNMLANACTQGEIYVLGLFLQNKLDYIIVLNTDTIDPTPYPLVGSIAYPETVAPSPYLINKRLPLSLNSAARTLANVINTGVESFDVWRPQLKLTRIINARYPIRASATNAGMILSNATLYNIWQIPNNVLFQLPNLIDPTSSTGKPVLQYGWYQDGFQVQQMARLKYQVVVTWEYGLWPVALYGTPI